MAEAAKGVEVEATPAAREVAEAAEGGDGGDTSCRRSGGGRRSGDASDSSCRVAGRWWRQKEWR